MLCLCTASPETLIDATLCPRLKCPSHCREGCVKRRIFAVAEQGDQVAPNHSIQVVATRRVADGLPDQFHPTKRSAHRPLRQSFGLADCSLRLTCLRSKWDRCRADLRVMPRSRARLPDDTPFAQGGNAIMGLTSQPPKPHNHTKGKLSMQYPNTTLERLSSND